MGFGSSGAAMTAWTSRTTSVWCDRKMWWAPRGMSTEPHGRAGVAQVLLPAIEEHVLRLRPGGGTRLHAPPRNAARRRQPHRSGHLRRRGRGAARRRARREPHPGRARGSHRSDECPPGLKPRRLAARMLPAPGTSLRREHVHAGRSPSARTRRAPRVERGHQPQTLQHGAGGWVPWAPRCRHDSSPRRRRPPRRPLGRLGRQSSAR